MESESESELIRVLIKQYKILRNVRCERKLKLNNTLYNLDQHCMVQTIDVLKLDADQHLPILF
jgi:hypothetical protein